MEDLLRVNKGIFQIRFTCSAYFREPLNGFRSSIMIRATTEFVTLMLEFMLSKTKACDIFLSSNLLNNVTMLSHFNWAVDGFLPESIFQKQSLEVFCKKS